MDTIKLKQIIEAALLASSQPLSLPQLETLFAGEDNGPVSHEQIAGALEALGEDCTERGIELVEVASGFRFQVRRDVHPWVARLWTERPSRYSRALLETLALIAYRQPITRGEIEQVRGVSVSSHITKTLEEREWIRVVGHRDAPGRPALFGTTRTFLDYFNLKSLDELPPLADILNLEEMEPQLALDKGDDHAATVGPPEAAVPETDDDMAADDATTEAADTKQAADPADPPPDDGIADETVDADTPTPPDMTQATEAAADADPAPTGQEDPEENRA